jgi:tetratricopeptide (TPR) repeat protein
VHFSLRHKIVMKNIAVLFRSGALGVAVLFFGGGAGYLNAQPAPETAPAKPPSLEQLSQAELLKSYLQVRDQLQATQLTIVNNRVEAEAAARAQTAVLTEKLEALKAAMAEERSRQQLETQRLNTERERQQAEADHWNRTVLWVAAASGGLGLLGTLLMPFFQWRAINRMAEIAAVRPQLPAPSGAQALLPGNEANALSDQTVALSNQRLMSALERIERKIFDFELTASQPVQTVTTASPFNGSDLPRRRPAAPGPAPQDQAARIALLLGKGRSLFNTSKIMEALTCYDEILKMDLNHPEALVRKGATLERLKQDAEAIQCYDRAIAADRKMTLAYLYKGGVCNRLERYEEALQCYEQALRAEEYA